LYFPTFTFDEFPMLFMGAFSGATALLALTLPETLGNPLVEKIEDIDLLLQNKKGFFSWWSSDKLRRVQEEHANRGNANDDNESRDTESRDTESEKSEVA